MGTPYRVNFLVSIAFILVILCLAITVYMHIQDEFAKGVVTLVLGRFLGYVDNIYAYEFGTTRSSAAKDATIKAMTETATVIASGQTTGETSTDVNGTSANTEKVIS